MKKIFELISSRLEKFDVFNKKAFHFLYASAFVCVMIIAVAQIGLRTDSTRNFFTKMDSYEGTYFAATTGVAEEKNEYIVLNVSAENIEDAQVWINGESYAALTLGDNEIRINETSVVEIFSPEKPVVVKLTDYTDGLILYMSQREVKLDKGIKVLTRVGIK